MSKPEENRKAVELRRSGLSYLEILRHVPVAKSTLSRWLRSVGLARAQKQRLTARRLEAARRGGEKVHRERLERVASAMAEGEVEARQRIGRGDWCWLVGTALYWAEGVKPKKWRSGELVMFSNMDPRMIVLINEWLHQCCGVDESDIVYAIQIHERADIAAARRFWAGQLRMPETQLRTYFKRYNPLTRRKNTGKEYYGTIRMVVRRSTLLNNRIACWIRGLSKYCGVG